MTKADLTRIVLLICIITVVLGCGTDGSTQLNNSTPQLLPTPSEEATSSLNNPVEGAREWIDASVNQDGNRFLKHTCLSQRDIVGDVATFFEIIMGVGDLLLGRGEIKGDVSDLKFEILNSSEIEAYVHAHGEVRVSVGLSAQARQIDETWHMVYENDTWRWCGSHALNNLAETSISQPQQVIFTNYKDVYSVNEDGTQLTNLTNANMTTIEVDVTADGTKIAFIKNNQVCVMYSDGNNLLCLTDGTQRTSLLFWSFDGKYLGFLENTSYYVVAPDGSFNGKKLILEGISIKSLPVWSPNDYRIALVSELGSNDEISVVNVETSEVINLSNSPAYERHPVWSPDGQRIAFESTPSDRFNFSIHIADVNSRQIQTINSEPGQETYPSWSPDGKSLAFLSYMDGTIDTQVYVVNLDTMQLKSISKSLINGIVNTYQPLQWSPDNKQIAVAGTDEENVGHIFVINMEDATYTKTSTPYADSFKWFSDSKKLSIRSAMTNQVDELYVVDVTSNTVIRVDGSLGVASWDLK